MRAIGLYSWEHWGRGRSGTKEGKTYTFTERILISVGAGRVGYSSVDSAVKAATKKATVVKKPNVFWARTAVECIASGLLVGGRSVAKRGA